MPQGGKNIELKLSHFLSILGGIIAILVVFMGVAWKNGSDTKRIDVVEQNITSLNRDNKEDHEKMMGKIDDIKTSLDILTGKLNANGIVRCTPYCQSNKVTMSTLNK